MRFTKEHRIELPMSRLLELTFDVDFMRRMSTEAMKVQKYENLARDVGGPTWTSKNRVTPQDNMPGFIKKLVGGTFYYEEQVTHQKGTDTVRGTMTPSAMADKLKMGYTMRVRPDGENACIRTMDWEVEVKIMLVGGQIEKFAAGEIERGTDASAQFMSREGRAAAPAQSKS
jgi:hypothetical protein